MGCSCSGVVWVSLLLTTAGLDAPQADQPLSPAKQVERWQEDYQAKRDEAAKAYRQAKTDADRRQAAQMTPNVSVYAGKILEMAQHHAKEPFVPEALSWIVQNAAGTPDAEKALNLLIEDHLDSKQMIPLCESLANPYSAHPAPQVQARLRRIMTKSSNPDVRGAACYFLASFLLNQESLGVRLSAQAARHRDQEVEKLLTTVMSHHAQVRISKTATLGDLAQRPLYEMRHLTIGKVAPEIEGEDISGQKFKLGDYRGKVVVLDFWGHW
jgi:hypothetical protein